MTYTEKRVKELEEIRSLYSRRHPDYDYYTRQIHIAESQRRPYEPNEYDSNGNESVASYKRNDNERVAYGERSASNREHYSLPNYWW